MHPHIAAVFSTLDQSMAALRTAVESVPPSLRRQRPAPDRWSVAEVLEHLALVEQLFATRIAGPIATARQGGLGPEQGDRAVLPLPVAATLANRSTARNAPEPARPTGSMNADEAMAALHRSQAAFRAVLMEANGLALSTVTHDHPFFGTLNAYQWAELIAGHEMRHVEQIREIAATFGAQ